MKPLTEEEITSAIHRHSSHRLRKTKTAQRTLGVLREQLEALEPHDMPESVKFALDDLREALADAAKDAPMHRMKAADDFDYRARVKR